MTYDKKPIKIEAVVTRHGAETKVFVGRAYQNESGYWAHAGHTYPCNSIEEAIRVVSQHASSVIEEACAYADRPWFTITREHVGLPYARAWGKVYSFADFMGRPLEQDIGKRVYLIDGDLQIENDEQRAARQKRERGGQS